MFNRYEIPELLTEVSTGWALGVDIPMRGSYYKAKAQKRRKILEAATEWNPTPALGCAARGSGRAFYHHAVGYYHRQG